MQPSHAPATATTQKPQGEAIKCDADNGFMEWLAASKGSLVVSTYQAGKLLMIGWSGNQLSLLMRHYDKPMSMDISANKLVLATRNNITLHANDPVLAKNYKQNDQYDALFLPKVS